MLKKNMILMGVCLMGFYGGCSSKNQNMSAMGEKKIENETQIESFETGIIVGSLLGHLSGTSVVAGTVVGGMAGFSGGELLAKMQQEYQDKEYVLAEKIEKSVENQKRLSFQIEGLNLKIFQLDKDIGYLKVNQNNQLLENKTELFQRVLSKKEELLNFKTLNDSAIDDVLIYNNLVSYTKYTEERKKEVEATLDSVLTNLFTLRKICNKNLEKLTALEERF